MSDDNIVPFPGPTTDDIEPDTILEAALGASLTEVVVLGYTAEGGFYFASTSGYPPDTLWMLELARKQLLDLST